MQENHLEAMEKMLPRGFVLFYQNGDNDYKVVGVKVYQSTGLMLAMTVLLKTFKAVEKGSGEDAVPEEGL